MSPSPLGSPIGFLPIGFPLGYFPKGTDFKVRDYFPKGTDFSKVTDEEVREMQDQLNGRPRQTLGWKKPAQTYAELLGEAA